MELAFASVNDAMPTVLSFLDTRYGTVFLNAQRLYGQVYSLVDRIAEGVPPNELTSGKYSGPADLKAILNSALVLSDRLPQRTSRRG